MNESIRTLIFAGVAAVVGLVAWISTPAPPASPGPSTAAELFKPFEAGDANSFKIVRYDEDEGKLSTFEVTRKDGGRWVIPSHDNYPADAEEQLKKIAGLFVELKPIAKVSDDPQTHELYGVKEPKDDASGDAKSFGRVVTIADEAGDPLVELIVGKQWDREGSSATGSSAKEARFVRRVNQDPVYVAEISLDSLTTKFEEWIERDLLKLNSFDVAKLELRDYSIVPVQSPENPNALTLALLRRMETLVSWGSDKNEWNLDRMTVYQGNEALEGELAEDEELNKAKLDGVKTAVDDLKIIDVDRKPQVLADALKDETLMRDRQAVQELGEYGFFAMRGEGNKPQILGSNGGLRISMKDGVQYVLNFGNAKSAEKGDSTKLNRYLMVTAQIDESLLPKPMLEPEDPEPAGPEQPGKDSEEQGSRGAGEQEGDEEEEEEEGNEQEDKQPGVQTKSAAKSDAKSDDEPKTEETSSDDAAAKQRERIKKENKRKLDEYEDKRKKAEARVAELNARFGEWFYVVSDDVYKKVQLGRADIVKDRESAKEEGFGVDAFRNLEKGGIEGKAAASPNTPPAPPRGLPPGFPGE